MVRHWDTDTYRVEPRFGLGTILLATLYCALVLTGCRLIGLAFPYDFLYIAGLVTVVSASQAWIRGWGPRRISWVAGAAYAVCWTVAVAVVWVWDSFSLDRPGPLIIFLGFVAGWSVFAAAGGALLGFCAGAIAASLFLFEDWFRARGAPDDRLGG